MFCTNCGEKIKEGNKFCTNCGAPVGVTNNSNDFVEGDCRGGDSLSSQIKQLQCVNEYDEVASVNNMKTVKFGSYRQSTDANTKESIEWIVLDKDEKNGKALLLSKYTLFACSYDENYRDFSGYEYVNWEECPLRKVLNEAFINEAFTDEERGKILVTKVINNGYDEYTSRDGKDTEDKIFLLSFDETRKYFKSNSQRIAYKVSSKSSADNWWVRTTFDGISRGIKANGSLSVNSEFTPYFTYGARLAMWIKF